MQIERVKVLEEEDFDGLYVYLEDECDGRAMLECGFGITVPYTESAEHLLQTDWCMHGAQCLSFHQILGLYEKT